MTAQKWGWMLTSTTRYAIIDAYFPWARSRWNPPRSSLHVKYPSRSLANLQEKPNVTRTLTKKKKKGIEVKRACMERSYQLNQRSRQERWFGKGICHQMRSNQENWREEGDLDEKDDIKGPWSLGFVISSLDLMKSLFSWMWRWRER